MNHFLKALSSMLNLKEAMSAYSMSGRNSPATYFNHRSKTFKKNKRKGL